MNTQRRMPLIDYNKIIEESAKPNRAGLVVYSKNADKILVVKNSYTHPEFPSRYDLFVVDEKRLSYKKFKLINDVNLKLGTRFKTRGINDNGIYFHTNERVDMFYRIVSDEIDVLDSKNGAKHVWIDIASLGSTNATSRLRWAVTRARKFQTMRNRRLKT